MNVYQKINEVKKVVKVLTKNEQTSGKGAYTYVSGSQILSAIKEKMEEVGLLFLPVGTEHRSWTTYNYKNSYKEDKTDFIVDGKVLYEWINIDEPNDRQRVSFEFYGQQNDISKAFGSALTYSERYLLLKSLGAPTDEDDPDKKTEDKKQATPQTNQNKPQNQGRVPQEKSKWVIINELIKNSSISLASINEWIKKKYNSNIKINELNDNQFKSLIDALKAQIEKEKNQDE